MAQGNKQAITVYGTQTVGWVSADGGSVRGQGGPVRPQLTVPLVIEMAPQPDDAMIAVTWLRAWLSTDQSAFRNSALCLPTEEVLVPDFAHSQPNRAMEHNVQLRFFITPLEVEEVERHRHTNNSDTLTLYLGIDVVVAGLKSFNKYGSNDQGTPWDAKLGKLSEVLPFWTARVQQPISILIEQSSWVREVLPGIAYDRLRLLELSFPPPLPHHANAAAQFDKAKRALDERRYADCIQACRGLLAMWEKQFGSTSKNLVADVVKGDRHWPDGDIRRDLLDTLWKEVGDVANALHHPEGNVNAELFDGRDARLLLLLTTALSEYVERR